MSPDVAVVLQQLVNGLSLGMMYALLALGFTMVYGIIELINFAHFNVFMAGTFFGLWFLAFLGYGRTAAPLTGITLALVFVGAFAFTMLATGLLGAIIERVCPAATRHVKHGADDYDHRRLAHFAEPDPVRDELRQQRTAASPHPQRTVAVFGSTVEVTLKNVLLTSAFILMLILDNFVRRTAREGDAGDRPGF
jgi:branched-chain amino acid transport system permease protein